MRNSRGVGAQRLGAGVSSNESLPCGARVRSNVFVRDLDLFQHYVVDNRRGRRAPLHGRSPVGHGHDIGTITTPEWQSDKAVENARQRRECKTLNWLAKRALFGLSFWELKLPRPEPPILHGEKEEEKKKKKKKKRKMRKKKSDEEKKNRGAHQRMTRREIPNLSIPQMWHKNTTTWHFTQHSLVLCSSHAHFRSFHSFISSPHGACSMKIWCLHFLLRESSFFLHEHRSSSFRRPLEKYVRGFGGQHVPLLSGANIRKLSNPLPGISIPSQLRQIQFCLWIQIADVSPSKFRFVRVRARWRIWVKTMCDVAEEPGPSTSDCGRVEKWCSSVNADPGLRLQFSAPQATVTASWREPPQFESSERQPHTLQ